MDKPKKPVTNGAKAKERAMAPQKKQKRRDRVRNKQPKEGRGRGEEGGPEEGVRLGSWPRTVRASPVAVGGMEELAAVTDFGRLC